MDKKLKSTGFTLIELMITLAIVGILAMIAYPSYMEHIIKTRRTEAQNILMQDANSMERLFTLTGCYNPGPDRACRTDDDAEPLCPPQSGNPPPPILLSCRSPISGTAYYVVSVETRTPTTYTLTAKPQSGTSQADDGTMTLDNTDQRTWSNNPSGNTKSWH